MGAHTIITDATKQEAGRRYTYDGWDLLPWRVTSLLVRAKRRVAADSHRQPRRKSRDPIELADTRVAQLPTEIHLFMCTNLRTLSKRTQADGQLSISCCSSSYERQLLLSDPSLNPTVKAHGNTSRPYVGLLSERGFSIALTGIHLSMGSWRYV